MNNEDGFLASQFEEFLRLRHPGPTEKSRYFPTVPNIGHPSHEPDDVVDQSALPFEGPCFGHGGEVFDFAWSPPTDLNHSEIVTEHSVEVVQFVHAASADSEVSIQTDEESEDVSLHSEYEENQVDSLFKEDELDFTSVMNVIQSQLDDKTNLALEEKQKLHASIGAAKKKLADYERRVVDLRRIHRQTHKKVLKEEEHFQRLLQKEKQRNEEANKLNENQHEVLSNLRHETAKAEEELAAITQQTDEEEARIVGLHYTTADQERKLSELLIEEHELRARHQQAELDTALAEGRNRELRARLEAVNARTIELESEARSLVTQFEAKEDFVEQLSAKVEVATPVGGNESQSEPANSSTQVEPMVTKTEAKEGDDTVQLLVQTFDDSSPKVRTSAIKALFDLTPDGANLLTRTLKQTTPDRQQKISKAIATSGLAEEALSQLSDRSTVKSDDARNLLVLMCRTGEFQPLLRAIEEHEDLSLRLKAVDVLASSGHPAVGATLRRVAIRASQVPEIRAAAMNALHQIS